MIEWVQKRDGRVVPFNAEKIADAIFAAAKAVGGEDRRQAEFLAGQVIHLLSQLMMTDGMPQVEQIQDLVENVLIEHGHARTAKAYILYRNRRTRIRDQKSELMDAVSEVLKESGVELPLLSTPLAKLQRIALAASEQYTLNNLLPRDFANAHQRASIHIEQLANYSMSVSALCIKPDSLLNRGYRLGHTFIPPAGNLEQLIETICQLVVLVQNEVFGEVLFADLDQAFAQLARSSGESISMTIMQPLLERLLSELDVVLNHGAPRSLRVSVSIGLDRTAEGRNFSQALIAQLARGLNNGVSVITPQVVYQIDRSAHANDDEFSRQLLNAARGVARQRGNPNFVYLESADSAVFASGLRLAANEPGLVARTLVNLPRVALEAGSSSEFWSGIDGVFSLVTRQLVHRHEVLSALPFKDLPLLLGDGLWAAGQSGSGARGALHAGQLSVVPVGIPETLQVARLRFGSEVPQCEADLIELMQSIMEHWRHHYALNFQLSQAAGGVAASRFLISDQQSFPLARTLWPGQAAYRLAAPTFGLVGGQFCSQTIPENLAVSGVVYSAEFQERRCPGCGRVLTTEENCTLCAIAPVSLHSRDGYLHFREGAF